MKIICIGRNYADHVKEMNSPENEDPVFFLKPDTALLLRNRPFYYPDYSNNIHYEAELVIRIDRNGKHIREAFANDYYSEIGFGLDMTARDLQQKCKQNGAPWEIAKGFDSSAPISRFIPLTDLKNVENIEFSLKKNGEVVQHGFSKDMIFSVDRIIAHVSKYITLKMGDIIFTGTPSGVGPVKIGDRLEGFIEDKKMLSTLIK
ncbi:MAG: 2-hydroxyhepta-2,4-diene-1,7-dioate isomerase [Marinilabiliales bacterium]|nr:MAG: 2-hydroxyhepta-2,4-diene-1,7-dioate isomerase [Marinilabiliales bacterium]